MYQILLRQESDLSIYPFRFPSMTSFVSWVTFLEPPFYTSGAVLWLSEACSNTLRSWSVKWNGLLTQEGSMVINCSSLCQDSYRQVSNIRRTSVGNTIVDHSDVVGASPVGAAPTTSSFST